MHLKSTIAAAASLVTLLAMPAWGQDIPQYVATCIRPDPGSCGPGRLEVDLEAKTLPARLPRHEFAPVGLSVGGTIETEGGDHPSALREATVVLDEGIRVHTKGLPTCPRPRLESLSDSLGGDICREAIIGRGVVQVGLASSERTLRVPLTLFNGGTSAGVTRVFAHGETATTGGDLVAAGRIRQRGKGLEATWKTPPILEGDGSLLSFRLEIKRSFAGSGRRRSYLSGSCPNGELRASFSKLMFVNEAHIPGVASLTALKDDLSVPCAPRADHRRQLHERSGENRRGDHGARPTPPSATVKTVRGCQGSSETGSVFPALEAIEGQGGFEFVRAGVKVGAKALLDRSQSARDGLPSDSDRRCG
jgi:hypothetical protein